MGITTVVTCDCGCKRTLEIGDKPVKGAEEMLQVTDCMGKKIFFITTQCFLEWASKYECPYNKEGQDVSGILPGGSGAN
jgi:hypothetical protein